ncbi:hypothetical protein PHISP_04541 [Aspergillus sp. HF37]|nr:hypothetical protein PHISP_04541 [Aspergillus sp. HF37]
MPTLETGSVSFSSNYRIPYYIANKSSRCVAHSLKCYLPKSFHPTTVYYASAAINAVSILGHIVFGVKEVDPAIATIPSNSEHALGKATATIAWDMVNGLLAASSKR